MKNIKGEKRGKPTKPEKKYTKNELFRAASQLTIGSINIISQIITGFAHYPHTNCYCILINYYVT